MNALRAAFIALAAAVLLCVAAAGFGVWVGGTESGTAWLLGMLQPRIDALRSIGGVEGTLMDRLVLHDVELSAGADEIAFDAVALRLRWRDLLTATVTIEELEITAADYRRGEAPNRDRAAPAFRSPLRVVIERATLTELNVQTPDEGFVFGATAFSAEVDGERIRVDGLTTSVLGFDVGVSGTLTGGATLSAELSWSGPVAERRAEGRGTVRGVLPRLQVRHELLDPFAILTEGEIRVDGPPRVDLQFQWTDFVLPDPEYDLGSASGRLRLTGHLGEYEYRGAGEFRYQDIDGQFELAGTGVNTLLSLQPLRLRSDVGELSLRGDIEAVSPRWSFSLEARDLDPGGFLGEWPGRLAGGAQLAGRVEPALEWALTDVSLLGELRGRAVSISGALSTLRPGVWRLDDAEIRSGPNRLALSGSVGRQLNLDVLAEVPEASALRPDLSGSLRIEGALRESLEAPAFSGYVGGENLAFGDRRLESLMLSGQLAMQQDAAMQLELAAHGLQWGELAVSTLQGLISGSSGQHDIELTADSDDWSSDLRAAGGFAQGTWRGSVDAFAIEQDALGAWTLAAPAALQWGDGAVSFDTACLARERARLCGSAAVDANREQSIQAELENVDLRSLQPFLPDDISAAGLYQASLSLTGALSRPTATFSVAGGETTVVVQQGAEAPLTVVVNDVGLAGTLAGNRLNVTGSLRGRETGAVELTAEIADVRAADPAIRGELNASWTDLAIVSLLSPDLGEVAGTVSLGLQVAGTVDSPELEGRIDWAEGRLEVPAWGLLIEGITAQATSADGRQLELLASGTIGEGQITLEGTTALDPRAGWPSRFRLGGESIQAVRTPEADIVVTPAIEAEVRLPDIEVTGTVHIPHARLVLDEVPPQAVAPSPDAVVHGAAAPAPRRPLRLHSNLTITLGEDVSYSGAGLTTDLGGELAIAHESGRTAVATGTVILSGQYEAYGQSLELERGRLLFAGPWDNPALDVRAVRRLEEVTAGVQLSGTLRSPQTRIFSEPVLSEADALSYLLFGRPLSSAGADETASLESAAISMGLKQALPAIERVGQSIGLDELSVRTTNADAGELMAGKYLSPRVYIRYTYGLFNRIGGLMLRLELNDRLSLETRSGYEKSMDLIYTVEQD